MNVFPVCDIYLNMYVRNTVFKRRDRRIMFPCQRFLNKRFLWQFRDMWERVVRSLAQCHCNIRADEFKSILLRNVVLLSLRRGVLQGFFRPLSLPELNMTDIQFWRPLCWWFWTHSRSRTARLWCKITVLQMDRRLHEWLPLYFFHKKSHSSPVLLNVEWVEYI